MKKAFTFIFLLTALSTLLGQSKTPQEVGFDALLTETQFSSDSADTLEMVWWLPAAFWEVSFAQDNTTTEEDIAMVQQLLDGYEMFAVVQGDLGYFGGVTYKPLEEIKKSFSVTFRGSEIPFAAESSVPADLVNFVSIIKPMMKNMLGPLGENVHVVLLEVGEQYVIDPLGDEPFSVKLGNLDVNVDLPLSSLLVEKKCPVDQKLLSGKWSYCPIHGEKLVQQ